MTTEVVITGLGATTPLGGDVTSTWDALRSGKSGVIPEGSTLLEAAERYGVTIPSSCRQGQCGTCATRLLAGEVRMDAEEGLDPELRRQGYVLTCVGRAKGDVRLDA